MELSYAAVVEGMNLLELVNHFLRLLAYSFLTMMQEHCMRLLGAPQVHMHAGGNDLSHGLFITAQCPALDITLSS